MNLKLITAAVCMCASLCTLVAQEAVSDTLVGGVKSIATSPAELLRGKLSGVRVSATDGRPDGLLNVNIRGLNTLRGDSQPLYIVDGAVIGSCVNHNLNAFYMTGGMTVNGDALPDYSGKYYTAPLGNFGWLSPYYIESVEVVKDMSAAALYGMQGANGVVFIRTRKPTSGTRNIYLDSNVGAEFVSLKGDAFETGIITSHNLGVNGIFGRNSYYNISGFLRYDDAPVACTNSMTGGLSVNIEMTANELFEFGFHSFLNYGDYVGTTGTNFIGAPSLMALVRRPDAFAEDTVAGYIGSYDDETIDFRTVNSVWLQINFLKSLNLRLTGGMDYQNLTRYIWFGTGTSFGKDFSGATSILNNSLMNFNLTGELKFDRNFAVKHHLQARLAYDLNGNINRTNSMCGTQFRNPALRGKGLNGSGSLHQIRKFDRSYVRRGGYATIGYDYDGFAGVSSVARCDHTSGFDRMPVCFPSVEAFADLKRIFLQDAGAVSALRIDGGYGWSGRETMLPYEFVSAYVADVPKVAVGSEPYFDGVNRLVSKEWNVGFSAGFLDDMLSMSFGYYDKNTEDMFGLVNYGKVMNGLWVESNDRTIDHERELVIRNNGFEADFNLNAIRTADVNWSVYANAAYNINSILKLDDLDAGTVEMAYGMYLSGVNVLPKVHGGFGTTLSLYGVTMQADFSGAAGHMILNANRFAGQENPQITADDLEKGDYLRLDCLTLAYDIPLNVRWIKGFRVKVSGHNLFTATDYSGWNPDVNSFGVTARGYGVDYGSFPIRRSVVLGLSVEF